MADQPSSTDRRPHGGAALLLVEPDGATRRELAWILRTGGYRVREAASFRDARRLLAMAPADALITALRLGPFNGLHLVLTERAARPELAAVVLLRSDDAAVRKDAEEAGVEIVFKPIERDALLEAVARALCGTRRVSG